MVKSSIPAYKTYLTILKLTAVSQLAKRWYPTLKYPLPKEKPVVRLNVGLNSSELNINKFTNPNFLQKVANFGASIINSASFSVAYTGVLHKSSYNSFSVTDPNTGSSTEYSNLNFTTYGGMLTLKLNFSF